VEGKTTLQVPQLTEERYFDLCQCCDAVLNEPSASDARIVIPWLHIIRPHPMFLKYYRNLFADECSPTALTQIYRKARQFAGHIVNITKACRSYGESWASSAPPPTQIDVLIISHLVSEHHVGEEVDFYFGNLPGVLKKSNINVVVALINFTERSAKDLAFKWKDAEVPRVILGRSLSPIEEFGLARRMIKETSSLRRHASHKNSELAQRVANRAALEANSSGTRWALRVAQQIAKLVGTLSPRAVILTHEGHSWERATFAAIRDAKVGVLGIGYQHATISYLQHAVRRDLAPKYNPDFIFTSGATGADLLCNRGQRNPGSVAILGSPRISTHPESVTNALPKGRAEERVGCLVLPEGDLEECNFLFEFSLNCAHLINEVQFIWRLHPNLTHEIVAKHNPKLRNLPKNISLSIGSIENDIARSDIALYRGTTAIIPAVMSGILPIYVEKTNEISIDTLWQLDVESRRIATPEQLQHMITIICSNNKTQYVRIIEHAQILCRKLLTPFDPGKVIEMLQRHGIC
jgi:hypothetical protein